MGGFRRRALSVFLGPFVLGIGFCILVAPPSGVATACMAAQTASHGCCEGEAGRSCPAPERAPSNPRCRVCDGSLQLSTEEKDDVAAPDPSGSLAAQAAEAPAPCTAAAENRLDALSGSPPLHLRNRSFRN